MEKYITLSILHLVLGIVLSKHEENRLPNDFIEIYWNLYHLFYLYPCTILFNVLSGWQSMHVILNCLLIATENESWLCLFRLHHLQGTLGKWAAWYSGYHYRFWKQILLVQIPHLLFISHVILGKLLKLSMPISLSVNGDNQFSSVQSLSPVQLFATPWIAAHQASLSITNTQSLLKPMSIELEMPSIHLILCHT